MNASIGRRIGWAVGVYLLLTVAAVLLFHWTRPHLTGDLQAWLSLGGPALSLFTHMSYALFLAQTLLLLPWLILGAFVKRARVVSWVMFGITWLVIGWRMHALF